MANGSRTAFRAITKVCIVQPVQSPYWTERLKILAQHGDLDLTLLLECASFSHRPGWKPEPIQGVRVEVLNSMVIGSTRLGADLGYETPVMRPVSWRLPVALWRLRPNVVVPCNATQMLLAWPLSHVLGFRLALIVEDTPHATRGLGWLGRKVRAWAYRRADRWFAFSEDAKRYLAQIGIRQGVVRSSWSVNTEAFHPATTTNHIADNTDIRDSLYTVLFVAQLVSRKGILPLLEAWKQLPLAIRRQSRLLVVGDGPLRNQVTDFVHKHLLNEVQILGQVPYDEVRELLRGADLFILPTLEDLYSLTVVEAMACGCPVITTPFNGARELVDDGRSGWIVDPTKPGALTSCLQHALSGNADLRQMGRAARSRVEGMDNNVVMSQFRQALVDLVGAEKRIR